MAANSSIEWCDHTFSPWHGCVKTSTGCQNCYALALDRRFGRAVWGPAKTTPRMGMSENYWKQPLRWQATAAKTGQRARVFCASMADVFEDHPQVVDWRMRLFALIDSTPMLDWLLLTKRPENVMSMMAGWLEGTAFPSNIWLGTSVENQEYADRRIPELLKVPARVRFLSAEPLLSDIDLAPWIAPVEKREMEGYTCDWGDCDEPAVAIRMDDDSDGQSKPGGYGWLPVCGQHRGIHWLIVGGESGHGARPMHPDWARSLRDQAAAAGVAYFFKQFGEYLPRSQMIPGVHCSEGEQIGQPDDSFIRVGKKAAGRLLDGAEWAEFPS